MPNGKVAKPEGPGAQATLGTVEDIHGEYIFFFNTANIKQDEPVIFDVDQKHLEIDGIKVKVKIATLEKDEDGKPLIAKRPWGPSFKAKWDKEWKNATDDQINRLNIKKKGKKMTKEELEKLSELWN